MFWLWNILISITIAVLVCAPHALYARGVDDTDTPCIEGMSAPHWQRVFDPGHPEAPPRLVLKQADHPLFGRLQRPRRELTCVRAGDRLVLHQASGASTLSLMARALESGPCGARIRARIAVTGVVAEVTIGEQGVAILGEKEERW